MDNFFQPDIKISVSSSKNNVQLNSKVQGLQNVNFQEILTNVNGSPQSISIENKPQLESLVIIQNETQKQDGKEDKNTIKSPIIEIEVANQEPSILYSSFDPQKPPTIEKALTEKSFIKKGSSKNIQTKRSIKKSLESNKEINLKDSEIIFKNELENKSLGLINNKKNELGAINNNSKTNEFKDNEEQKNKKKNQNDNIEFSDDFIHVSSEEFVSIISNYGWDISNILSRGELDKAPETYEDWIKSLLFGISKENLLSEDISKVSSYITQKNDLSFNEHKAIKELISELLKHEKAFVNNNSIIKFSEKAFDFICKMMPQELMKGFLKKVSKKDTKERSGLIKSIVRFINADDTTSDIENIKGFILEDLKNKNTEEYQNIYDLLFNKASKHDYKKLYNFIISEKLKENLIPGFFDFMCSVFIETYENNQLEKTNQIVRIIQKYFSSEIFNENEQKLLSNLIVKKVFDSTKIEYSIAEDKIFKIINGEIIDINSIIMLEKASLNPLLEYLPYNINKDVRKMILDYEYYEEEIINTETNNFYLDEETQVIFTTQIKLNNQRKKYESILHIFDITRNKEIILNTDKTKIIHSLECGEYRIIGFEAIINNINMGFIKLPNKYINKLTFTLDNLFEIFVMGRIELSINQKTLQIKNIELKNNSVQMMKTLTLKNFETKNKIVKINSKII